MTPTPARHALCGAHLAREIVAAGEAHPVQGWPEQALRALHGLNTAAHNARDQHRPEIPSEIAQPLLESWRHALLVGLAEHRRVPGRLQSKTRNLLERLRDRDAQVLLFARDLSVPFTNNQAERRPPHQDPDEDQRLPPLGDHRQGMAPRPQLHLHRPQARRQRPRRHHQSP